MVVIRLCDDRYIKNGNTCMFVQQNEVCLHLDKVLQIMLKLDFVSASVDVSSCN